MRPNNQNNNKRSRGRNSGRKNQNPLSRNFESNGPDVKVRGNAAHIAEKYVQLARDSQASGDSVGAENYFQHAEHYNRLVAAAQAQIPQRQEQPRQGQGDSPENSGRNEPAQGAEASAASPSEVAQPETSNQEDADNGQQPVVATASASDDEGVSEQKPRKPRERRPRRKPQSDTDAPAAPVVAAPADAPQSDASELPAFLTGGGQTDAAE